MGKNYIDILLMTIFVTSSSFVIADSNGYTTAANVYTGSSSRTWYGGGVAYVLAEWKKERSIPAPVESETIESASVEVEE